MSEFDIRFVDKNSERKMLYERIERICRDLNKRIFDNRVRVTGIKFREGQYKWNEIDLGEWRDFGDEEYWGYKEQYCWFRQTVTIPESFKGRKVVFEVNPHPYSGYQRSFQFILFVNGKMVQGIDPNHNDYPLTYCAEGGETFDIALNAYCDDWEFHGQGQMYTYLKTVDTAVSDLYYDIAVPLETAHFYTHDDLPRVDILKTLNEAVSLLELSTPDIDVFHESVKKTSSFLHENLYGESMPVKVSAIGHTHIDVAWLWRLRQTRDKAGRTFASVMQLMREFPDFKFMSPQAQLYDYVKQDYPELYEEIKERAKEGRWEVEGSMWVESDTNVISGESLVRQFLVGKRFFKQEFGVDTKVMWLPDVFGYSGSIPQIMKLADIDYFVTTKISWSEFDRLPFDTFMWKGIDGSEVLSHFVCSMGRSDENEFRTTYNSFLGPKETIYGWQRYSNKDLNRNILSSYGFGDGGGGPTRTMVENGIRMDKGIPGCPKATQEFAGTFLKNLEKDVAGKRNLPKWSGELYLEFHRGTLTSQARNKRYNRKSEYLLQDTENLNAIARLLCGSEYPSEELLEDWKLVLLNQFHDIIPGSSIFPVYEDSKEQYEQVLESGRKLSFEAMTSLVSAMKLSGDAVVVFNTLGFTRSDIAAVETDLEAFSIVDADGKEMKCQKTFDGKYVFLAENVPAKGWKAFYIKNTACAEKNGEVVCDGRNFETPHFSVKFDENLNITSLIHKETGRSVAKEGELLNRLIAYEDRPNCYDAWDVKVFYDEKFWYVDDVQSCEIVEDGSVRTVMKVVRNFNSSVINQYFIFYTDFARIDVQYVIDWKESDIILKADYPVDVNANKATYDIQFGNIERTTHNNTTWDFAEFEACGHKWADLSDNSFGLSVLNDCKYGWAIKEGHIKASILRCATNPNYAQDREIHNVTYSIYPHAGSVASSDVVKEAYALNLPLYSVSAAANDGNIASEYSFVSADEDNIVIETVKKAEDSECIVVRTYETWNKSTQCTLTFPETLKKAYITNLLENKDEELPVADGKVELSYRPFEIKSLKLMF